MRCLKNIVSKFRKSTLFFTAIVLSLLTSSLVNASFERALKIYNEGRFAEAKVAFETMAAIGDPSSLFNLGVMYYRGEAVERDPIKAFALMKIASEGGGDDSFLKIIQTLSSGFSNDQQLEADELYKEMSEVYGLKSIEKNILPRLLDDEDCAPDLKPVHRGKLVYPKSELRNGRMGVVHTEFTISPEGYPREIVVTASTSKAFTKAAIKALNGYRYLPSNVRRFRGEQHVSIFQIKLDGGAKVRTASFVRNLDELKAKANSGDVTSQFLYARSLNTYRSFKNYFKNRDFQYREANEWYTKSAAGGVVNAQFEIGRNMLEGRGCEVDRENGFKWVKAAAIGGYSPAQKYLATSELSNAATSNNKNRSIISWLRNAAQDEKRGYSSKVLLAWELVSSPEKSVLNPDEALSLIKNDPSTFKDDIRLLETKAAAYALKGDFEKAVKLQMKAQVLAQKKEWEIPEISQRLGLYQKDQSYIGSYY